MVEEAHLPRERTEACKDEYRQVAHAYERLIGLHIDRDLAKNLFDKNYARRENIGAAPVRLDATGASADHRADDERIGLEEDRGSGRNGHLA